MGRVLGIGLAILAHAAILLFGGLLFLAPPKEQQKKKEIQEIDLVQDETKDEKKKEEEKQPEEEAQEAEESDQAPMEETEEVPDLRELVQLDAAAAAPALDAMSLSALADSLDPGAAGGAAGFFADSVDLGSGGRIGGTGKAVEASALDEIFSMAELDQKPRPLYQAPPSYPFELRRRKVEGTVQVLFVVNEQGRVVNPTVEAASHPEFERAALDAVRQWKFEPAVREGRKVQCRMRVPLRFSAS